MNWLMFKAGDDETLKSWGQSVADCLKMASPDLNAVELVLPTAEKARSALAKGLDLMGCIVFSFKGGEKRKFEIPLPYHGFFVARGASAENKNAVQRLVWSSWLGEMPGLRQVRVPNGKTELRLGLPDGRFIRIGEKNKWHKSDRDEIAYAGWWAKVVARAPSPLLQGRGGLATPLQDPNLDLKEWAKCNKES